MSYRCLCCLSQNNLRGLGIKEWYICNYILHPYITKHKNISNNKMARLCGNCHQSFLHIDRFRNQAIQSYLNLIVLWNKELKETNQEDFKTEKPQVKTEVKEEFESKEFINRLSPTYVTDSLSNSEEDIKSLTPKFFKVPAAQNFAETSKSADSTLREMIEVELDTQIKIMTPGAAKSVRSANVPRVIKPADNVFRCTQCEKKYASAASLEKHDQIVHKGLPSVTCTICNKTLKHKFVLQDHIRIKHSGDEKVFCATCDKLILKRAYKTHLKYSRKHNLETTQKKERKQCTICNKSVFNMSNHMTTHNDVVYCRPCNKVLSKNSFKYHLESSLKHNRTRKYICDDCGARFLIKKAVEHHILTVHLKSRGLIKCPQCPKSYMNSSSLKSHIAKIHDKIPPIKNRVCEVCGVGFETNYILKQHMVTHTKERPYKCDVCGVTFGFSSTLYTHKKLKHKHKKED